MSSAEKDREVYYDAGDSSDWIREPAGWWYQVQGEYGWCSYGPYPTEEKATEAMRLHGLEE